MKKLFLLITLITFSTAIHAQGWKNGKELGGAVMSNDMTTQYWAESSQATYEKVNFQVGSSEKITMPVYRDYNRTNKTSIGSFTAYFDATNCQMVIENNCSEPIMVKVSYSDGNSQGNTRVYAGAKQRGSNKMWDGFRGHHMKLNTVRLRKCAGIGHDK